MPNVGDPTYAADVIADIGSTAITTDSSATTSTTETGSLASVTVNLISGETYWVELICLVSSDNTAVLNPVFVRIREDSATGNQIGLGQLTIASTATTGMSVFVVAQYTAIATGSKTFVVTLQRNAGAANAYQIRAGSGRNGYLRVRRQID